MKPEDVPAELLDVACDRYFGTPSEPGDDRQGMACALAAVLPVHAEQVRAKVAAEIEAELVLDDDYPTEYANARARRAAEIARGAS